MPFVSKAQRKYINAAAARGEIPQSVADKFNEESKGIKDEDLPHHRRSRKKKK
jgi:hypothetical protein